MWRYCLDYLRSKQRRKSMKIFLWIFQSGRQRLEENKNQKLKKEKAPTKEERIQFVQKKIDGWAKEAADVLLRYLRWMEFWKEFYKPESMETEWHPLFAEALQNESKISYLVDILMFGTSEEILDFSRTEGMR